MTSLNTLLSLQKVLFQILDHKFIYCVKDDFQHFYFSQLNKVCNNFNTPKLHGAFKNLVKTLKERTVKTFLL